jgi:trimeric autotransporter adhesin
MMPLRFVNHFSSGRSKTHTRSRGQSSRHPRLRDLEILESRQLLATFTVTNLSSAGTGSFRQAILSAN